MSEYQSYEFVALDRPLTAQEQSALRKYSSRATITSGRFAVDYSWGDFKGDADDWMEKYFDAFLYRANWGCRQLMLRLPKSAFPLKTAKQYCAEHAASVRASGEKLIFSFSYDDDGEGEWLEEDDGAMAAILPVRAELAGGDLRALYLGWLACVEAGELDDEAVEPACPPGLGRLSPALEAFANLLGINPALIEAAAAGSPAQSAVDDEVIAAWLSALPDREQTSILVRLVKGNESGLRGELLRRFRESRSEMSSGKAKPRTVSDLLSAAESREEERQRKAAEQAARERARLEREAAQARERQLTALAKREDAAWEEVEDLLATRSPTKHDEATRLLVDLREVCVRGGRQEAAAKRIRRLREQHANGPALIDRLRKAGLVP